MRSYLPLIAGLLLPIAVFLNVQAITAPGWLIVQSDDGAGGDGGGGGGMIHQDFHSHRNRPQQPDPITYIRFKEALALCLLSLLCGFIAAGCLCKTRAMLTDNKAAPLIYDLSII